MSFSHKIANLYNSIVYALIITSKTLEIGINDIIVNDIIVMDIQGYTCQKLFDNKQTNKQTNKQSILLTM